jgi:hypothetical protein
MLGASVASRLLSGFCHFFGSRKEGGTMRSAAQKAFGEHAMSVHTFSDPAKPMPAVAEVWKENRDIVDRFRLEPFPGGVVAGSWFVMVHCGVPDADAYELGQALLKLENLVERKSGLDVTLMLSNSVPDKNGTST